jgi:hypothetical protein
MATKQFLTTFVLAASLGIASTAAHAYNRNFSVANHSNTVIEELFVSPDWDDGWGPDQLGNSVLYPGDQFNLQVKVIAGSGTGKRDQDQAMTRSFDLSQILNARVILPQFPDTCLNNCGQFFDSCVRMALGRTHIQEQCYRDLQRCNSVCKQ